MGWEAGKGLLYIGEKWLSWREGGMSDHDRDLRFDPSCSFREGVGRAELLAN